MKPLPCKSDYLRGNNSHIPEGGSSLYSSSYTGDIQPVNKVVYAEHTPMLSVSQA